VFDQKFGSAPKVMHDIKNEINERRMACGTTELSSLFNV
jgi:hypothetical protein